METLAFIFAIGTFFWCAGLEKKVKRLERLASANNLTDYDSHSLRDTLKKHMGQPVVLELYEEDMELLGTTYRIVDIDEQWLQVQIEKRKKAPVNKLIRLDMIRNVKIS